MKTRTLGLFLASVLCLCAVLPSEAGSLTVNWTQPVLNTDSTPIPATGAGAIAKYTLYYGVCVGGALPATPTKLDVTAPALTAQIDGLAPGVYCVAATATNTFSVESDRTGVATKSIVAPKPTPPASITVASLTILQVLGTKDRFAINPVGTVPADTPCDTSQPVGKYYVVPITGVNVSWYGNVRPPVVVASCS